MVNNYLVEAAKNKVPTTPPPTTPKVGDDNTQFGNWTGDNDTKSQVADLMKRGLIGASDMYQQQPDISNRNGIVNTATDWKPAAVSMILENAKRLNLRTPEAVMANKDTLIANPKWRDAINNPVFQQIHPNFWQVITRSILPQQWAKYDAQNKTVAKK